MKVISRQCLHKRGVLASLLLSSVCVAQSRSSDDVDDAIKEVGNTPADVACDVAVSACDVVQTITQTSNSAMESFFSIVESASAWLEGLRCEYSEECLKSHTGVSPSATHQDERSEPPAVPDDSNIVEVARRAEARLAAETAAKNPPPVDPPAREAPSPDASQHVTAESGAALLAQNIVLTTGVNRAISFFPDESTGYKFELRTLPTNGKVELLDPETGPFVYTPDNNYRGEDSFTFAVRFENGIVSDESFVLLKVGEPRPPFGLPSDSDCEQRWIKLLPGTWTVEGSQGNKRGWSIEITMNAANLALGQEAQTWAVEEAYRAGNTYTKETLASSVNIVKGSVYVFSEKQTREMCGFGDHNGFYFDDLSSRIYWSYRELYLRKDQSPSF